MAEKADAGRKGRLHLVATAEPMASGRQRSKGPGAQDRELVIPRGPLFFGL